MVEPRAPLTFLEIMHLVGNATETDIPIDEPYIAPMGWAKAEPPMPELMAKLRILAAKSGVTFVLPTFPEHNFDVSWIEPDPSSTRVVRGYAATSSTFPHIEHLVTRGQKLRPLTPEQRQAWEDSMRSSTIVGAQRAYREASASDPS